MTMQEFYEGMFSDQCSKRNAAFKFKKQNGIEFHADYAEVNIVWTDGVHYRCYDWKTKTGKPRKRCNWHVVED